MTGAVEKASDDTVLAQVTYTYDALGNRIGMDENGTQTWTLYDGSTPIMDFNSSGSLEMRYLNGPTGDLVDSVIARESSGGTVAWYLPDRLGTIRDLINNSGAIIDHIDFSAFGTVLDQSDPSEGDRMMGFAGMELDSVTGMNLAVYRVQDPGTGRWTSQDPWGFAGGEPDLYEYAGNFPTAAIDPLAAAVELPGPWQSKRNSRGNGERTGGELKDLKNWWQQVVDHVNGVVPGNWTNEECVALNNLFQRMLRLYKGGDSRTVPTGNRHGTSSRGLFSSTNCALRTSDRCWSG